MSAAALAGAMVAAGLVLALTWAVPARAPLGQALARLGRPRPGPAPAGATVDARLGARLLRVPALRRRLEAMAADLAVLRRRPEDQAAQLLAAVVVGALWAPVVAAGAALVGVRVAVVVPAWLALAGAGAGAWLPLRAVRADAARARQGFAHALGAFCDVASMSLAAGRQVEGALQAAATAGQGWAFEALRGALHTGYLRGQSPWESLAQLGAELEVPDLVELAGALALAGDEGARVRDTIGAKARSVRERLAAELEREAASVTERMGIPATFLLFGFAAFLGFPALYVLFSGGA